MSANSEARKRHEEADRCEVCGLPFCREHAQNARAVFRREFPAWEIEYADGSVGPMRPIILAPGGFVDGQPVWIIEGECR